MKKVSTFELLKKSFRNEVFSQQARSAKFQAEMTIDTRVLKKLVIKIGDAILVAYFNSPKIASNFSLPIIRKNPPRRGPWSFAMSAS